MIKIKKKTMFHQTYKNKMDVLLGKILVYLYWNILSLFQVFYCFKYNPNSKVI